MTHGTIAGMLLTLLFDVQRAAHSFLSRLLGFKLLPQTFDSEYGRRQPLVRGEKVPQAQQIINQAEEYLSRCGSMAA
jgi:hypothetical protein